MKHTLKFSQEQVGSMLSIMQQVSRIDSEMSAEQRNIIDTTENYFQSLGNKNKKW